MRILYFYQYFTTPKGAWGTRAYEFARRWVDEGHQVTVVTSVYDKSDLKPDGLITDHDVEGIKVRVINVQLSNKHNIVMRAATFLLYAAIASWYALTMRADLVVASSGPLTVGLPGLVARWIRRRPFVFEVRDLFSEGLEQLGLVRRAWTLKLMRSFEAVCYRTADVVVALSPSMAEWIERDYDPRRVEVIPNASDNALFAAGREMPHPEGMNSESKAFVFTGTIGTANDCGQLIEAAITLRERGVEDVDIYLIGDGKERASLEERAAELALTNIHFVPLMPKEQLVAWLAHARAALLILKDIPVFETVSPNKLFDALASGLPVIQTTRGWVRTMLAERECGLTVDFDVPDSLADHIMTLAGDDELCRKMGENAAGAGRELYDRDDLSRRYTALMAEVIGS